jgi:hypothetical protein
MLLLMSLPLLLSLPAATGGAPETSSAHFEVHVHPDDGDDSATGRGLEQPVKSFAEAQRRARAAARAGVYPRVDVVLAAGRYFNTSVVFTEEDSILALDGQQHTQVTWRGPAAAAPISSRSASAASAAAEEGASAATVYGGVRITGWRKWRGDIWSAPLPHGLSDSKGRALFRTLVQGERSAWLARSPNFGSGFLPCGGDNVHFSCGQGVLPDHFDCVNSTCSVFLRAMYSSDIRAVTGVDLLARRNGGIYSNVNFTNKDTDDPRGFFYLQGPLQLLDQEGEWAVVRGTVYFWPYSVDGMSPDMNEVVITAPITQRVFSFVGKSRHQKVSGITLSGLRIVGADMPLTYTYKCASDPGAGGSASGANCTKKGGFPRSSQIPLFPI